MKIKHITGILTLLAAFILLPGFGKKPNYFVIGTDTTFCKTLNYETDGKGNLKLLEYMDIKGKTTVVEGKDHCPDVNTFFINGVTYEKVPYKIDDAKAYRYTQRVVDGTLKVYLAQKGTSDNPAGGGQASGFYRFYIKMPDGKFYQIDNKEHMNTHIKPYMLKCEAFKKEYKGGFDSKEDAFKETVKLYNSLCSN